MALHDQVNINTILACLDRELEKLRVKTDSNIELAEQLYKVKPDELLETARILIQSYNYEVLDFCKYWSNYIKLYNEAVYKDTDLSNKIMKDNEFLRSKLIELANRYNKQLSNSKDLADKIGEVVSLVEDNASSLGYHVRIKRSKGCKGPKSPSYIQELDTQELVSRYIKADYKLTSEIAGEYQEKFGITYNGLRNRLIQAGVWKANRR